MQRRPLHLAVVGGGSNAQSMVLGDGGQREQKHVVVDEDDDHTIQCRPRTPREREDIMRELVRIEKRHWDKGSSWGDQLPTLVAKRNAYVFVVLDDAAGVQPVAYAVLYVNALHAQMSKLFTMPAWRGQGVATRLVRVVLGAVRRLKGPGYEVTLMVEVGNLAAQAVYERCGFRREADEVLDYYAVGRHAWRMKTSWP